MGGRPWQGLTGAGVLLPVPWVRNSPSLQTPPGPRRQKAEEVVARDRPVPTERHQKKHYVEIVYFYFLIRIMWLEWLLKMYIF